MHYRAEAAIGRRQLARSLRQLASQGFAIRDVQSDADSVLQSDRVIVGPSGVYLVGFCGLSGNLWRSGAEPFGESLEGLARSTHEMADVVSTGLLPDLTRLRVDVQPLLTVIGPEQARGAKHGGLPLLGPIGLVTHLTRGPAALIPMQVDRLVDRVDDWLARRSVAALHPLARRHNVLT